MDEPLPQEREIELKLDVTGLDLDGLREAHWLTERLGSEPSAAVQNDIYWDTEDRRLRKAGFTLRTRRIANSHKLTLKCADRRASLAMDRREWEVTRVEATPDLSAFGDPAIFDAVGAIWPHQLQPLFAIDNERERSIIEWGLNDSDKAVIELAVDRARLRVGKRSRRFDEIELELKAGKPAAITDLALRLAEIVDFRLSTLTKADRGFGLLDDEIPQAVMADEVALRPAMPTDEAMSAILQNCIGQAIANIVVALDGRDIEGVHQLRVALRRGQAAVKLFSPLLSDEHRRHWSSVFRDRRQHLGKARDLDVLLHEMIERLPVDSNEAGWLAAVAREVERERREAQVDLSKGLDDPMFSRGLLELAGDLERRSWQPDGEANPDVKAVQQRPAIEFARAILARAYKKTVKLGKPGLESMPIEKIHEIRLKMKALRYGVDFFAALFAKKRVKPFRKRLKELQELLGQVNDVEVAAQRLEEALHDSVDAVQNRGYGYFVGWYSAELKQRLAHLQERWDSFVQEKPFWA